MRIRRSGSRNVVTVLVGALAVLAAACNSGGSNPQSYQDGFQFGYQMANSDLTGVIPSGDAASDCNAQSSSKPKGDDGSQWMSGCIAGYKQAPSVPTTG